MFLSVRRHASRKCGFSSIIIVAHAFFCGLLRTITFDFRQGIQVEERTKFCLHSFFESL